MRVRLQKKNGKAKSTYTSPSEVMFEAGSVRVSGLSIAIERSSVLQMSLQTKHACHLQNRHRNQTGVHLIVLIFTLLFAHFKKKKKMAAQAWNRKG